MVLCLYTSVIPKRGGLDNQAKSTDVAKLAFRTVVPCSLTVCWRTHDDMFVTDVLDSVIFETLTLHLNWCWQRGGSWNFHSPLDLCWQRGGIWNFHSPLELVLTERWQLELSLST